MSTAETAAAALSAANFSCGKCSHLNTATAKFCGGCGHSLFEPCSGCGQDVRLNEKFCGRCGTNLELALISRVKQAQASMASAVLAAKDHHYADAICRLQILIKDQDQIDVDLMVSLSAVRSTPSLRRQSTGEPN